MSMSEKMFRCPYNPAHVMKQTRAHHHVVNCRKAHFHKNFIICSFNALHHYPPEAEADHLEVCADRIALRNSTYLAYEDAVGVTGNLSMPPPAQIEVVVDESWDE